MKVRLGDVATYINGYAFKPDDWGEVGKPIIRIQDLTGNSYQTNRFDGNVSSKYLVVAGDVLISWSASLGVYVWSGEDAVLNQHIFKVVFDKADVDKSFFIHQVSEILRRAASDAHGATMKHLTKPVFDNLSFYLPEIHEQKSISCLLDKIASLIAARRQQLTALDTLIKARFVEMFGDETSLTRWPCCKIGEIADVSVGVVIKPAQYYTDESGIPAFRSLNIGEMCVKDSDWVYFTEEGNHKNCKSILHENDIVIVRSGAPGTACVITSDYVGYNAIDIIIARPDTTKVNPLFLCAFTNFPHGKKQIEAGIGGAAQQHFNVGKYKDMTVCLPPLELQNRFAAFVAQVDKSKAIVQKALDEAQTLFDSLMQQYFG